MNVCGLVFILDYYSVASVCDRCVVVRLRFILDCQRK